MSGWLWWVILNQLTGNPLVALLLLVGGGWAVEQTTLGVLPGPLRLFRRWRRTGTLRRQLAINPHNRQARFELADLLIQQRRWAAALEWLKPNVAAGDQAAPTLFLMGVACYGAGHAEQAEAFLTEAKVQEPGYRMGAIDLELGRGRLRRDDHRSAKEALDSFCAQREGTIEGRVLLAAVCEKLGEQERAASLRAEAWKDYAAAPRFAQRQERLWAWRLRPWRPAVLGLGAAVILGSVLWALPLLRQS